MQNPFLALGAEPFQLAEPVGLDRLGQPAQRGHAQLRAELERAPRAERRNPGQLPHPGRDLRPELLQRRETAALPDLMILSAIDLPTPEIFRSAAASSTVTSLECPATELAAFS